MWRQGSALSARPPPPPPKPSPPTGRSPPQIEVVRSEQGPVAAVSQGGDDEPAAVAQVLVPVDTLCLGGDTNGEEGG